MNGQERLLIVVEKLVEVGIQGVNNATLAKEMNVSESTICRDLAILEKRGWVEKKSYGENRLTPKFAGYANTMARSFFEVKLQLKEDEARYHSVM